MVIGIFAAHTYTGTSFAIVRGLKPLTMDHVFNGTFYAQHSSLRWVKEGKESDLNLYKVSFLKCTHL